eukprot:257597-Chlamydomonas_euryale.AAC.1
MRRPAAEFRLQAAAATSRRCRAPAWTLVSLATGGSKAGCGCLQRNRREGAVTEAHSGQTPFSAPLQEAVGARLDAPAAPSANQFR